MNSNPWIQWDPSEFFGIRRNPSEKLRKVSETNRCLQHPSITDRIHCMSQLINYLGMRVRRKSSEPIKTHRNPSEFVGIHQKVSETNRCLQDPSITDGIHCMSQLINHLNLREFVGSHLSPSKLIRIRRGSSESIGIRRNPTENT